MLTKTQLFSKGFLAVAPHMFSVIPFGIICGAIGIELGFDPVLVYAMSIIIFGGASQIVFLQLLSGGASALIAITSVGVINSRHLLYGAVLSEYLENLSFIKKLLISYIVVDQGFAESNKFFMKNKNRATFALSFNWKWCHTLDFLAVINFSRYSFRIFCTRGIRFKICNTFNVYSNCCSRY